MLDWVFEQYGKVANFYYNVMGQPVLGDLTLFDIAFFGVVATAVLRFIILPMFGRFGSSSRVKKKYPNAEYRSEE